MRTLAKRAGAAALLVVLTACSSPVGGQAVAGSVSTPSAPSETMPPEVADPPEQAPISTKRAALPKRPKPLPNPSRCRFRTEGEPAREVTVPKSRASARGTVRVTMRTTAGRIGLTLHRELAPCTVHSMMTDIPDPTTPGGARPNEDDDYLTAEDRERLAYWRSVVAKLPPMTPDQIESVAGLLRIIDDHRT